MDAFATNISKKWQAQPTCSVKINNQTDASINNRSRNTYVTESEIISESPMMDDFEKDDPDDHSNNIIEGAARSKVSRSSMGSESMGLSSVTNTFSNSSLVTIVLMLALNRICIISS